MGARLHAFLLAAAVLQSGCGFFFEPTPDVENLKSTTIAGLSVKYPGNWKTELESEDMGDAKFHNLTIESSGSALAFIQVFEPGVELTPQEVFDTYAEGMVEASKSEFGGVIDLKVRDSQDFTREVLGSTWTGRTAQVDLSLFDENVPHRIQTVHRNGEDQTVLIVMQAPIEDWTKISPGFDVVYDGLSE